MKLLYLQLHNFKGIKTLEFTPQGDSIKVLGDNATGKTTLFDAMCWLLFGKDSLDRADFTIKTLDAKGKEIPRIDHMVVGKFEHEGEVIELSRLYKEVWSTKRGSATEKLTSHTTDYCINGAPKTAGEYKDFIESIIDVQTFKLLANPVYFSEIMPWADRRKLLLNIIGDVTDAEVLQKGDFKDLQSAIGKNTIDEFRTIVARRKKTIKKEIDEIPGRLDELHRMLPQDIDTEDWDVEKLEVEHQQLLEEMKRLQTRESLIENGQGAIEYVGKAQVLEAKMAAYLELHQGRGMADREALQRDIARYKKEEIDLFEKIKKQDREIVDGKRQIERLDTEILEAREEFQTVAARQFDISSEQEYCPCCGQQLPIEQREALIEKAQGDFMERLAKDKAAIRERGKTLSQKREALASEVQRRQLEIESLQNELCEVKQSLEKASTSASQVEIHDHTTDEAYKALEAEYKEVLHKIERAKSIKGHMLQSVAEEKEAIAKKVNDVLTKKAEISALEDVAHRIATLHARHQELAGQLEEAETLEFSMEDFIKAKVAMIEDTLHEKFTLARFRMFEQQMNGGIKECCEVLYNNIPYSSLNHASQINIGLDIISGLSKHFHVEVPIFIDNAEAVTQFIETGNQTIYLCVKEGQKTLDMVKVKA